MRRVICVDDKNQLGGTVVTEGKEYLIEKEFTNNWGEKTYLIHGVQNEGRTSKGLEWFGFRASRFAEPDKVGVEEKEYNFALN